MVALPQSNDEQAQAIGALYARSRDSLVDSVRHAVECGRRLQTVKDSLPHGDWLPWLKTHRDVLGFGERAAQRMLGLVSSNPSLTTDLEPADAVKINRQIWGNATSGLILQSNCNEWYTPCDYIEAARRVLGAIDLDPASSEHANATVNAARYFSSEDDGLSHRWTGRVWLNPPYGGHAGKFIAKLAESCAAGDVTAAVALVNAHCTDTEWFQPLWDGVLCFTNHRITFQAGHGQNVSGATFGSVFAYFGSEPERFAGEFQQFGTVVRRYTEAA